MVFQLSMTSDLTKWGGKKGIKSTHNTLKQKYHDNSVVVQWSESLLTCYK